MWVRTGLCEPALVAALLLILWIRMLPQLLRGRLEKLVPSEQLLVTLMFKISAEIGTPRKRHGRHEIAKSRRRSVSLGS